VTLDLKYYWYFIFGGVYGLIEELFITLGIYSHNWYRTWMTVIGFPILIWVAKKMYLKILKGIKPVTYYGYIYMGLFALYVVTLLWGLDVAGLMRFTTTSKSARPADIFTEESSCSSEVPLPPAACP
jgi:hypothetical protein